jgi:hypothetical protein
MKFETFALSSLFAGCLLLCVLTLGAMLIEPVHTPHATSAHVSSETTSHLA